MVFYIDDDYRRKKDQTICLYRQTGQTSSGEGTWAPIAVGILTDTEDVSGTINLNWATGGGNLVDSLMQGIAEGAKKWVQAERKVVSTVGSAASAFGADFKALEEAGKKTGLDAQKKNYNASTFYKKYDGSTSSVDTSAKFMFMTTSSDSKDLAVNKLNKMMSHVSPKLTGEQKLGNDVRGVWESPPNDYYNGEKGFGNDSYHGTFALRVGEQSFFKYLIIDQIKITQSIQQVRLSSGPNEGSYTPLSILVEINLSPAGRVTAEGLSSMILGPAPNFSSENGV